MAMVGEHYISIKHGSVVGAGEEEKQQTFREYQVDIFRAERGREGDRGGLKRA